MACQGQAILGLGVRHTPFGFQRWCTRGSWPFVVADRCRRCGPLLLQETVDFLNNSCRLVFTSSLQRVAAPALQTVIVCQRVAVLRAGL